MSFKMSKTLAATTIGAIIGGCVGLFSVTPVTQNVYESVPGVGINRQCGDSSLCNAQRSRELASGRDFAIISTVDNDATAQKRMTSGLIGAVLGGSLGFLIMMVSNHRKNTQTNLKK
jgi:hypothetical protein